MIVFVHGESYEWNSGNPYDGSVLASYGQVSSLSHNINIFPVSFKKLNEKKTHTDIKFYSARFFSEIFQLAVALNLLKLQF